MKLNQPVEVCVYHPHDRFSRPKTGIVKLRDISKAGTWAYDQTQAIWRSFSPASSSQMVHFLSGDWRGFAPALTECQAGLNKGEARHSLAKAVFSHSQSRIHDRSADAQQKRAMALNLIIAAIVYWNTMYMDKAAQHLLKAGQLADPSLLRHVSPLGWMHINLTGDFVWNSGVAERMNARLLHLSVTRKWAL
jgi:hypothetical protein